MVTKKRMRINIPILVMGVLLLGALGFGGYLFRQNRQLKTASNTNADKANAELVTQVDKIFELPKDEQPVIALVSDEATFKKEYPVFTSAKQGDDLLLYEKAGQAILYRPSAKKVIGTASFSVKRTLNVGIIATTAEQATLEATLTSKLSDSVKVTSKTAASGTYAATQVIDLTGKQAAAAKTIAETVGGTVASALPAGEKAPDGVDIVVVGVTPATQPVTP